MRQSIDQQTAYQELRRRAVAEFGEARAVELEEFLQTAALQVAEVEQAGAHPDLEPLLHS